MAIDVTGRFSHALSSPAISFCALEAFAGPVLLHDHVGDLVDPLVAGEAPAAFRIEALAPTTDDLALSALARVDDLVSEMAAERALHAFHLGGFGVLRPCP